MFLNCGKFVEINLELSAAYLFNDLSKTFTNVLQIKKLYKNYKKIPQRQSWTNCGSHADLFFCSSPIFSGKIVDLRTLDFFVFAHQCFVGAIWTLTFQKGGLHKKG